MKPTHLLLGALIAVALFYLATAVMDWGIDAFVVGHIAGVLIVVSAGMIMSFFPDRRGVSYLVLSSGFIAAIAGGTAYVLYPTFASEPASGSGLGPALGFAFGGIVYPCYIAALGLVLGWVPAWAYLRLRHVA